MTKQKYLLQKVLIRLPVSEEMTEQIWKEWDKWMLIPFNIDVLNIYIQYIYPHDFETDGLERETIGTTGIQKILC